MAIFPNLSLEETVQENDKTRLNATRSFTSPDEAAVSLVEIEPDTSAGFFDVTGSTSDDWFLDWQYSSNGTKTITVRVTTDGSPVSFSKTLDVLTEAEDSLFSSDADLVSHEPDILNYLSSGKSSFLNFHRSAQRRILAYLDEHRIWDTSGNRLTKEAITDVQEVEEWAIYETLALIFESLSNAIDDIFFEKAQRYRGLRDMARNRGALRLDRNGDSVTDSQKIDMASNVMVRR